MKKVNLQFSWIFPLFLIIALLINFSESMAINHLESDGSVLLPAEKQINVESFTSDAKLISKNWIKFQESNPSWTIMFDKLTGMPHRAFGKPLQIIGYDKISKDNIKNAAISFLKQNADLFKVNTNNLKLRKSIQINNLWTVSYSQIFNNIEVILTEVELRITSNGKVMAFGLDYYNDINITITPVISPEQARKFSYSGLDFDSKKDKIETQNQMFIIPVRNKNNVKYKLVYNQIINLNSKNEKFESYVDASNGEIVWRRNLIMDVKTDINIKGQVKEKYAIDPILEKTFANMKITVGSSNKTADIDGKLSVDIENPTAIRASLQGTWASVNYSNVQNGFFLDSLFPGEPFTLLWNNSNSHRFERSLYYHANYAHDFYKNIDPESEAMDFNLKLTIYNQGQPNAGSDLQNGNISFQGSSNTSTNFCETPSVLYHEYGHSVNTRLYKELGVQQGMINMACQEGLADVNAAFMLDDSKIGRYAYTDTNKVLRNIDNSRKYPKDVRYESHYDGQIIAGAWWDVRLLLGLDYSRKLVQFTKKMGTPDDEDMGVAFSEWFIETLITDDSFGDGDNDLSNGSPNALDIIKSFNKHDIGTSLLTKLSFEHTPLANTLDTENPYEIDFHLENKLTFIDNTPENVKVIYSIDNFKTQEEVLATDLGAGDYQAYIPAQERGTIMRYYMTATDKYSQSLLILSADITTLVPYEFLIGYKVGLTDDFEENHGWIVGDKVDNSTTGLWELGVPQPVNLNYGGTPIPIQPGQDHTTDGVRCLVTGASNGGGSQQGIFNNMPNGITSVVSPIYDISSTNKPLLRFYRFYTNIPLGQFGNRPSKWATYMSSDGGATWTLLEISSDAEFSWYQKVYNIEDFVEKTKLFRIKFTFIATSSNNVPTSLSEGLVDDLEILTANDNATISDVQELINSENIIQVYPNPFVNKLNIQYHLNSVSTIKLSIYDILGTQVVNLIDEVQNSGIHNILWNGLDNGNNPIKAGFYYYILQINNKSYSGKIIHN